MMHTNDRVDVSILCGLIRQQRLTQAHHMELLLAMAIRGSHNHGCTCWNHFSWSATSWPNLMCWYNWEWKESRRCERRPFTRQHRQETLRHAKHATYHLQRWCKHRAKKKNKRADISINASSSYVLGLDDPPVANMPAMQPAPTHQGHY